jgi:hypothetical protein
VAGTTVGELLGFLIPVAVIYVASGLVIRAGECAQDVAGLTIPTSRSPSTTGKLRVFVEEGRGRLRRRRPWPARSGRAWS